MKNKPLKTKRETALANLASAKGPVSPQGKAIAKMNATKGGIYAATKVLAHLGETRITFNRHVREVIASYRPANYAEKLLVERIAFVFWQLRRLDEYRFSKTLYALKQCDRWAGENAINGVGVKDADVLRTFCALPDSRSLEKADTHETHLTKTLIRLSSELRQLQMQNSTLFTATQTLKTIKSENEPTAKITVPNASAVSQTLSATRIQR